MASSLPGYDALLKHNPLKTGDSGGIFSAGFVETGEKHRFAARKRPWWELSVNRGVVERFIAPVLKTGDPLRGPGVRIPPPLLSINQTDLKPRIRNEFEVFCFHACPKESFFTIRKVGIREPDKSLEVYSRILRLID